MKYFQILHNGILKNNPAIVQLLGLCPLLAISNNTHNAISLGIATILVLCLANFVISLLRNLIPADVRIPIFIVIIASFVSIVQLLLAAYNYSLYKNLGIFLALITTNCAIIARVESFAYKNPPLLALLDGFAHGVGFLLAITLLGMLREIIATGAILGIKILPSEFLLAALAPGAFFIMGFLLALKNYLSNYDK